MPRNKETLKLFVWHDVLTDYTSGMVCIMAYNFEQAIELARNEFPTYILEDFAGKPYKVYAEPQAEYVYGGG